MSSPLTTLGDIERLLVGMFFLERRFDKDGGSRIIYTGRNQIKGASTANDDWVISKYEYDSQGVIIKEEILIGVFDDRTTIF